MIPSQSLYAPEALCERASTASTVRHKAEAQSESKPLAASCSMLRSLACYRLLWTALWIACAKTERCSCSAMWPNCGFILEQDCRILLPSKMTPMFRASARTLDLGSKRRTLMKDRPSFAADTPRFPSQARAPKGFLDVAKLVVPDCRASAETT